MKIDFFEEITNDVIKFRDSFYRKFKIFYNQVLKYFNQIQHILKRYIEIKYYQYDLYKKYKKLGEHVSKQQIEKNVSDFSYDSVYQLIIKEINQINLVIKTISAKDDINHKS